MKLTIDFDEYKPWSGAVRTYDRIVDANMLEELESFVEELYFGEDSISETTLNDLLWHDSDYVLGSLGLLDDEDESFYEKRTVRRPTRRVVEHRRPRKERIKESKESNIEKLSKLLKEPIQEINGHKKALPIYSASKGGDSYPSEFANFDYLDGRKGLFVAKNSNGKYYAIDVDLTDDKTLKMLLEDLENDFYYYGESLMFIAEENFIDKAIKESGLDAQAVAQWERKGFNSETLYYDVFRNDPTWNTVSLSTELIEQIKSETRLNKSRR